MKAGQFSTREDGNKLVNKLKPCREAVLVLNARQDKPSRVGREENSLTGQGEAHLEPRHVGVAVATSRA